MGFVIAINRPLEEASIAGNKVDTAYCIGVKQAMCDQDPVYDFAVGNIFEARKPNDSI